MSHIGGEGRTAFWSEVSESELEWPEAPSSLAEARQVRLVLLTAALFHDGWRPGWLAGEGVVPGTSVKLELVSAAVNRPLPLSGWDLRKRGPKATSFMAPTGSVHFCRVKAGDPRELWLKAVSDNEQDRRDGFGIVALGEWK